MVVNPNRDVRPWNWPFLSQRIETGDSTGTLGQLATTVTLALPAGDPSGIVTRPLIVKASSAGACAEMAMRSDRWAAVRHNIEISLEDHSRLPSLRDDCSRLSAQVAYGAAEAAVCDQLTIRMPLISSFSTIVEFVAQRNCRFPSRSRFDRLSHQRHEFLMRSGCVKKGMAVWDNAPKPLHGAHQMRVVF